MTQIFVFTAGNFEARQHLADSIENPIDDEMVFGSFSSADREELERIREEGNGFYAWGAVPGTGNERNWDYMNPGDYVLCVYGNAYHYAARILDKYDNRRFAERVWGTNDKGKTRQYVYFLSEVVGVNRRVPDVANYLNRAYLGFTRIAPEKVDEILNDFGSVDAFIHQVLGGPESGVGDSYGLDEVTKWDMGALEDAEDLERLRKLKSKLGSRLDRYGDKFVTECEKAANKIMHSDPNWHNNLGKCLDPALVKFARDVQKEAQAEVEKLDLGLTVPTFAKPHVLVAEITAGRTYSDTGEKVGGLAGGLGGAASGAALGSVIFPVVGTAIGGLLGGLAGLGVGAAVGEDTTGTLDKGKSLTRVRDAAEELRPALMKEAQKYLDLVEKRQEQAYREEKRHERLDELYAQARWLHQNREWQAALNIVEQIRAEDPNYPDAEELISSVRESLESTQMAASEQSHGTTGVDVAQAYAVARLKDHQPDHPFFVSKTYVVQAGIRRSIPEDLKVVSKIVPILLPKREDDIQFDVVVHAEDMEISPAWMQTYSFSWSEEPQLLSFVLKPTKPGRKQIRVEFIYQRHWLAKIQFEVEVLSS